MEEAHFELMSDAASSQSETVSFKRVRNKKGSLRKPLDDEETAATTTIEETSIDQELDRDKLRDTLEVQRLRKRTGGVSDLALAVGRKLTKAEMAIAERNASDPFKIKTGGLIDLKRARIARALQDESGATASASESAFGAATESIVGTQFSRETRTRDEDEEMRKFIDDGIRKRRQEMDLDISELGNESSVSMEAMAPEERALMALPAHLRKSSGSKSEEMLSSQMLSGIPEVDLGIEEKIRNIEATEKAKLSLKSQSKMKTPTQISSFHFSSTHPSISAPTSGDSSNSRRNLERIKARKDELHEKGAAKEELNRRENNYGNHNRSRATDDLHVTKFKQHFHRK